MKKLSFISIILWFACTFWSSYTAHGQIIDDSVKNVYGVYTTKYYTFEDFKYNKYYLRTEDSTILKLHRYSMIDGTDYKYQNLGNLGTSLEPIFYTPPKEIGRTSGFYTYVPYMFSTENIQYFDTKSPYTHIKLDFGGAKRTKTSILYTRNISPFWNFGLGFKRITAIKQVGASASDDRQTASTSYYLQSNYQAPQGKYRALFNVTRTNHTVKESGGVNSDTTLQGGYFGDKARPYLENAESRHFKLSATLLNEYRVADELQGYYQVDYRNDRYFYTDKNLRQNIDYYDSILLKPPIISNDSTTDRSDLKQFVNEVGLKGDLFNAFYNVYIKVKSLNFTHRYLEREKYWENYAGFNLRYDIDSVQDIRAFGEYMVGGNYRFGGTFTSRWLEASYSRTQNAPPIIYDNYFGNHFEWHNDFNPIATDVLGGAARLNFKKIRFEPEITITNVRNNIYFDENAEPKQASGNVQLMAPKIDFGVTFLKVMNFETQAVYTLKTGETEAKDAMRVPELFVNANLYFAGFLFNNTMFLTTGVQANYKSEYYAKNYNPVIQQFYLQNGTLIEGYTVIDFYLNFRMDNVAVYIKYEHLNQGRDSGYFTFPEYVGQRRNFGLGVSWMFFN